MQTYDFIGVTLFSKTVESKNLTVRQWLSVKLANALTGKNRKTP